MQKKLTITLEEEVYYGLKEVVGPGKIGRFIEELVRPYVLREDLKEAYRMMAKDEEREQEASEWEQIGMESLDDEAR